MAQAETTLQQRIDDLDRKLTAKQLEEFKSLVSLLGFELKPIKPKLSIRSLDEARYHHDGQDEEDHDQQDVAGAFFGVHFPTPVFGAAA